MALQLKNFKRLVQDQAAAIQARASNLLNFTKGSILRAVIESNAAIVLWLESLVLYVLSLTRASTSVGPDLDSWMADYNFDRLGAGTAAGFVTFSRLTPTAAGFVPTGAIVMTQDRAQRYTVLADTTTPTYSVALGGYTIAPSIADITVPIQAQTAGSAANVVTGAITTIFGAMPGIDSVANDEAITGGADAETDEQYRERFHLYVASFSKATPPAVGEAIDKMRLGISYTITENKTPSGVAREGYFYVVVDDGSGAPSDDILTAASKAVERVRPLGITYGVFKPEIVNVYIDMTLEIKAGYDANAVKASVGTAIAAHVNGLTLGNSLYFNKLSQVAFDASNGVKNVTDLSLNNGMSDISVTPRQVIKTSAVTVN
jgi:uncharacterized phage protein gp47/JayE